MRNHAIVIAGCLLLGACDKVENPRGLEDAPPPPPTATVPRRVMLEKFTGHRCTFCPAGELIANDLVTFYNNQFGQEYLYLVSIHEGPFAELQPPDYDTDFTTPAGNAYGQTFAPSGYPQGMINRTFQNNSYTFGRSSWGSRMAGIIGQPAAIDLRIDSLSHDAQGIHSRITVKLVQQPGSFNHALTLYLLESHIIDWQIDGTANPPDIPNYEHNHVLRGALNNTWGQDLDLTGLTTGDSLTVDLSNLDIPSNVLDINNCYVLAYVYRTDTYEVLQVTQEPLHP
jgi:hypothetical protein